MNKITQYHNGISLRAVVNDIELDKCTEITRIMFLPDVRRVQVEWNSEEIKCK